MTELKVNFPTEKLEALRFFISKKDQSIEQELQDYLDKTYEKMVPAQVRSMWKAAWDRNPHSSRHRNRNSLPLRVNDPHGRPAARGNRPRLDRPLSRKRLPIPKVSPSRKTRA
jgi:hypothetical protein